jgi:GR25 family glycosyltransferase involved in LPS biosynthesis
MIDNLFVINLNRRPDRMTELRAILPKSLKEMNPQRWPAIDGKLVSPPKWYKSGPAAWGCLRSHLNVLEHAMMQNLTSYMVLEDDCCFRPNFDEELSSFFAEIRDKEWGMAYIGGQLLDTFSKPPEKISENCYKSWNCHRLHAVIVNHSAFATLYHHLVSDCPDLIVDYRVGELHSRGEITALCPARWLVGQRASHSDLMERDRPNDEYWLDPCDVYESHQMMSDYFKENPLTELEVAANAARSSSIHVSK